jgi:hypothetical protein
MSVEFDAFALLRDQALGPWAGLREVWDSAYRMARKSREQGQLRNDGWREFVSLVETHMPGLPHQVEERIRTYEQEREKVEAARRDQEQRDPRKQPLAERLQQILDRSELTVVDRMRRLGHLCAARWWGVGVVGPEGEPDLPRELWSRVLDTFLLGLGAAEETPVPNAEGAAFSHLACSPQYSHRLTEAMIRKWLPVALTAHVSSDWAEVIRGCWAVSQPVTEQALTQTLANEPRRSPILLGSIPSECWTEALTVPAVALLHDDTINPLSRGELLGQLVAFCPEQVDATAAEWAGCEFRTDEADQLRQAGRNALLVRNPSAALDLIEPDFAVRGAATLQELPVLWGGRWEARRVQWELWPMGLLERLGRLLLRAYPPADDPEFRGGFVTPAYELRELRGQLVRHLLYQPGSTPQEALDRLADMDQTLREWVATHRASLRAGQLLPTVNPGTARDPDALSVAETVRLLDRAGYRLVRTPDDLLDAVIESLRQVQADVGHDLPMLYATPDRRDEGDQPRKHLHEDALQAYLRRRLLDLLPRIVDEVEVLIVREDQVARRQRLDLRVTAPCRGTRKLATVVIEVKWSTNNETRTGLVSQLGQRYLLGEGLTHGVFFVGWSGQWWPGDGSGANTDDQGLERFLTTQRDNFCCAGQPGARLRIEPFILDVRR